MANIVFSPEARRDLLEIGDYVAFKLHNRAAARKLIGRIQKSVLVLQQFPESGAPLDYSSPHILYWYLICRNYLSILFGDELSEE